MRRLLSLVWLSLCLSAVGCGGCGTGKKGENKDKDQPKSAGPDSR